jgi:hypothetical protein
MSWEQLQAIEKDRRLELDDELSEPPVACPNDGEPLIDDPAGGLRCRFDGWSWPEDAT